ncbi:hypothetical protein [Micromonospora sp. CPCC 206061]|uniref:hypothetical protein n=1 Tax=Micromonospora sp. CPCC 206061 TaxID=3122410 RepID=UPI002FEFF910
MEIALVPAARATDAGFVAEVADLVDRVCADAESGLWRDGVARTDPAGVAATVAAGELVAAWLATPCDFVIYHKPL